MVGDAICNPCIKRWLLSNVARKPEIAYAILNYAEQAYLLASGQTKKRALTKEVDKGDWAGVESSPYDQIIELAVTVCTKLESAARGGEAFTPCMMWENSKLVAAVVRPKTQRQAPRGETRGGRERPPQ